MADPWAAGRGSNQSAGIAGGYPNYPQQGTSISTSNQFQGSGPPKPGMMPPGPNMMYNNQGGPSQQPGYGPPPQPISGYQARPPGGQGMQRPPGQFPGQFTGQGHSATPPPVSSSGLRPPQNTGITRSNSNPTVGPQAGAPSYTGQPMVNGLPPGQPYGQPTSQAPGMPPPPSSTQYNGHSGPPGPGKSGPQPPWPGQQAPWPGPQAVQKPNTASPQAPTPNMQNAARPPFNATNMGGGFPRGAAPPMSSVGPPGNSVAPPGMTRPPIGAVPPQGVTRPAMNAPPSSMAAPSPGVAPPRALAPPPRMGAPPPSSIAGPPTQNQGPPQQGSRPNELPLPYHGQGQYSHQVTDGINATTPGLTPNNSGPPSQKSSRAPSPVPGTKYDALEGQFSPSAPAGSYPSPPGLTQRFQTPPQGQSPTVPPFPGVQNTPPGPTPPGMHNTSPPMGTESQVTNFSGGPQVSPPPPGSSQSAGITGRRQYPQMPQTQPAAPVGQPSSYGNQVPTSYTGAQYGNQAFSGGQQTVPNSMAGGVPGVPAYPANSTYPAGANPNNPALASQFNNMNLQPDSTRPVSLMQEKNILPPDGVESLKPDLPLDYKKANTNQEIFRCTLNSIPNTQSLLTKSRLPLGILIHPFKDLAQLPVIQSSVIVRCRSCRTYINPFVTFLDMRRWKCNLCYRANELPDEFNYDPVSKTYGEPQRRPEIRSGTIEFIAPSEYMLRPPQPAVYLFVLDVSFNARETGYLQMFCQTLLEELDRLPGDARTQVGFIAFDSSLYFFNLAEGLSQPQLLVVSDVEEVFLPAPDNLLVNLQESKELVTELLNILPEMFKNNIDTGTALGPALEAAYKLMSPTGGRMSVFQTQLPTVGNGSLKNREDPSERSGKKVQHLGPATDFYKRLALECSAQQVAVDLFMLNSQYSDLASIACISKYSGGSIHYFPGYHRLTNPPEVERFESVLRRYLTRKIGFEAVMRIRCSRGLSLHTFHGNFFVRSTDLLSLPNVNPDSGFGMQMSIEDTIDANYVCFQAALLYTSSKGERRIRVHTLAVPVANQLSDIHAHADQQAIAALLSKMAVDKSLSGSMGDARDAMLNSCVDMLDSYGKTLTSSQRMGQLPCPYPLRLQPLYTLALLKSLAFRTSMVTKLDDRVFAMEECKSLPVNFLLMMIYPNLYPLHNLDDRNNTLSKDDETIVPQPPLLQLSSANMDRHGAYLMDTGSRMYLWVGAAISDQFSRDVLDKPNFASIPDPMLEIPELDNPASELVRAFLGHLNDQRPFSASLLVLREDSRSRSQFLQHMVDDRTESALSYYEFLQHLQKEVKS